MSDQKKTAESVRLVRGNPRTEPNARRVVTVSRETAERLATEHANTEEWLSSWFGK